MKRGNSKDNAVFESLRSFFYAAGERVGLNMTVYVRDECEDRLEVFHDADVELMIGGRNSIIIRCKDKDLERYEELGMKAKYFAKTAKFKYEEFRDYQTSYKELKIQPNEFEDRFIILNPKKVN
ncbi:hypothetical protein OW763_16420 [Clostridium aestuarii]|uniref:Uncharacterized protein n=1 Tax=Clostridium aestuarii TaxID=338193 RepID=A0ABT4D3R6_9CLOT|nr:hypothetical protein [Clostridium aestuarii]MCY6485897.1 hypothetical protein [Clostridium aestuarii]